MAERLTPHFMLGAPDAAKARKEVTFFCDPIAVHTVIPRSNGPAIHLDNLRRVNMWRYTLSQGYTGAKHAFWRDTKESDRDDILATGEDAIIDFEADGIRCGVGRHGGGGDDAVKSVAEVVADDRVAVEVLAECVAG